jgi:hypothetical protein
VADDRFELFESDVYAIKEQLEFLPVLQRSEPRKILQKPDTSRIGD